MKKFKILLVTTKALTLNIFFKKFINQNPFELTLGCSDISNLKYKKKIDLNFESNFFILLNPFMVIKKFIDIRKKILLDNKFDLVITNNPLASFYLRLSLFFSSQKIAYFVHGYRFHNAEKNYKYFIFYLIEKILSYRTQYYININQEDYFVTKKNFLVNPNKILLLPSVGIDVKKIKSFKKKKINKKFKIGVVAAYRKNKGYNDLIKVSEFLQNKANISIDCYGYDNSQKYQKIIDKKKITNIKLYPFQKNLYSKFRSFDLFCHLSRREGMPISIIESICLGIPVVAFNIRGCSDLIKNGYNGFLIEPYDLIKFKNVLLRIIKGDIDIKKIKKNCEVMNLKKHDKNYINKKLINFIKYACQNYI